MFEFRMPGLLTRSLIGLLAGASVMAAVLTPAVADTTQPDPIQLLTQSDEARGGTFAGVTLQSTVTEYRNDNPNSSMTLEVSADKDNSLVVFTGPSRVRGNKLLVRGRNMWFASRDVSKPVPISPRQRVLGEASNGDIALTQYARDYDAKLVGADKLGDRAVWVLDLRAKASGVAYDRIRYYIDQENLLGVKAEFQAVDGTLLKTATMEYGNTVQHDGGEQSFLSLIEITDAVASSKRTVLEYSDVKAGEVSSSLFSLTGLTRP